MTGRLLLASVRHGAGRLSLGCLAVALGVSLPAALAALTSSRPRLERELKAYGADVLVLPSAGRSLDGPALAVMERLVAAGRLDTFTPVLVLAAEVEGRRVAVVGVRTGAARTISPWWTVEGTWPADPDAALVGANAAAQLDRRPGDRLVVTTARHAAVLRVAGILRTGGAEENQVIVDLPVAKALAGQVGGASAIHARTSDARDLPAVVERLSALLPDAEVRTPYRVARAEAAVMDRVQRLVLLVSGVVLTASALGVFAAVASRALERRREAGIMKALGADERRVMRLLAAEVLAVGLVGGLLGLALGLLLAEAVAWRVFGGLVVPDAPAVLVSLAVGLAVSLGAGLAPLRRAARTEAAAVLRGD